VVQNARSIESQEEEHRSFADDDGKSASKKRAESTGNGRAGTVVSDKQFGNAQAIITANAEGALADRSQKTLEGYQAKARALATQMQLQRTVIEDANNLCDRLVKKQTEHERQCTVGSSCRLSHRPKHAVMAGAIIKIALLNNNTPRQFAEIVGHLEAIDESVRTSELNKAQDVVKTLLKFERFPCGVEGPKLADEADEADEADGPVIAQRVGLVPRIRDALELPYIVERIACDIVRAWSIGGIKALTNQTVVACALLHAYKQIVAATGESLLYGIPPLSAATVAKAVELEVATVERGMRDLPPPPPLKLRS